MLPLIRQLHDADGDRARAKLLLAMPDAIVLKYSAVLSAACEAARFAAGGEFISRRVAAMRAVRNADGDLPAHIAEDFGDFRRAFAAFAKGDAA